jgi:hypothetical protein
MYTVSAAAEFATRHRPRNQACVLPEANTHTYIHTHTYTQSTQPPYFPLEMGPEARPEHPQKLACRFETRGSVKDYCSVAAKHLDMGGFFVLAFPIAPEWQERYCLLVYMYMSKICLA